MQRLTIVGKDMDELKKSVKEWNTILNGEIVHTQIVPTTSLNFTNTEDDHDDESTMNANEIYGRQSEANVLGLQSLKELNTRTNEQVNQLRSEVEGDIDSDSEGLPWDERIHSSGKSKNLDGTWKAKKRVAPEIIAKVKAELYSAKNNVAPVAFIPPAPLQAPVQTITLPAPQQNPVALQIQQPIQAVSQPAPVMPTMAAGHTVNSFIQGFPLIVGQLIGEGKLAPDFVNALCKYFGVTQITMINDNQKAEMFEGLVRDGIIIKVG